VLTVAILLSSHAANFVLKYRISKTMGESFKLHAQALVGYEGELLTENNPAGMDTMPGQGLMTVETAY
jgi:hypothetical protein